MIEAIIPKRRKHPDWRKCIQSKEDYDKWMTSGMYWVHFDHVDEEIKLFLKELEENENGK